MKINETNQSNYEITIRVKLATTWHEVNSLSTLPVSIGVTMRMTTNLASIVFALALLTVSNADTFLEGPNQFDIEFVTIGSPGNEPTRTGSGDVAYLSLIHI